MGDDWQQVWEANAPGFGIGSSASHGPNVAGLGAIMRHVFKRRALVKDLVVNRVPTYAVIAHNVALLLNEIAVAASAARAIGDAWRLLEWLEEQRALLEDVQNSLKMNEFRVADVCSMDEMDDLKQRSNNLMATFGKLALSLDARSAEHLAVYWAL